MAEAIVGKMEVVMGVVGMVAAMAETTAVVMGVVEMAGRAEVAMVEVATKEAREEAAAVGEMGETAATEDARATEAEE